jgi:hypothetical protein
VPVSLLAALWRILKWQVFRAGLARFLSDLLLGLVPILLGLYFLKFKLKKFRQYLIEFFLLQKQKY